LQWENGGNLVVGAFRQDMHLEVFALSESADSGFEDSICFELNGIGRAPIVGA
jgi:hypothetical protein